MEIAVLAIILVVFFSEWREFKLRAEMGKVSEEVKKYSEISFERVEALEGAILEIKEKLTDLESLLISSEERSKETLNKITDAGVDLATIVQEYEINGIWLGKDRKAGIDAYEG
jgi:hypothetical protein